jgi:hypothetical protein
VKLPKAQAIAKAEKAAFASSTAVALTQLAEYKTATQLASNDTNQANAN